MRSLEAALAALGPEDSFAKIEVESALRRAKQGIPVACVDPDIRVLAARERVSRLERALAAMEDFEGPEALSLRTALKRAQEDAQEVPVEVQIRDREAFIERARKRIAKIDKERASEVRSLEEAKRKLNDLKAFRTVPVDPASTALSELEQLQMRVAQLQTQNDELLSSSKKQAVGSGAVPDGGSRLRDGRKRGQGSLRNSIDNVTTVQHSVEVRYRYGLCGVRVAEYLNPGPKGKMRRRRVTSSPDPTDSDPSAFLDGFEQDLCPVVSNGVDTQVFPTVDDSPSTTSNPVADRGSLRHVSR